MTNTRMEGRLYRLEGQRSGSFAAWVGIPLAQWPDQMLEAFICSGGGEEWHSLTDSDLLAILEADSAIGASAEVIANNANT